MYNNIRGILFGIIFIVSCIIILKSKWIRKKMALLISGILCLILCTISTLIPVENLFIDFDTPEDVFYYTQKGNIVDILHGEDSCLVYYSTTSNTFSHCFIKKDGGKYKILTRTNTKKLNHTFSAKVSFNVYSIENTQDYFVLGTIPSKPDTIDITNESTTNNINVNYIPNTHFMYFHLSNISNNDYIEIEGQKFPLLKQ